MTATATQLQQLYIAYFGRAADPVGLDYWVNAGTTTETFAASMYAQDEFNNVYGSLSIENQINQLYQNLFGRNADVGGLIYWAGEIRNGVLDIASFGYDLIYNVQQPGGDADDLAALNNKTAAAIAFTEDLRNSAPALLGYSAKSTSPFVVGANFESTKTFFNTITATNSVTEEQVQAQVDVIAANPGNNVIVATPTYTITPSSTAPNEGATLTTTISTTDVTPGTTL